MSKVCVDVVVIGGGIAGLWTLYRLRQAGFSAILLESQELGCGQTIKSQGIIHGGMKYALSGVLTTEALEMQALPGIWRNCLNGSGQIDLSHVRVLSQHQYLWAPNKFTATVAGLAASKALSSHVEALKKEAYPTIFQEAAFKGQVFELDEMVLDVPSLIKELVKVNEGVIFKIAPFTANDIQLDVNGEMQSLKVMSNSDVINIHAQQFVFTAGSGNEVIIKKLNHADLAMQKRPLHMTMVKVPFSQALYAHCLTLGVRPRITITTHYLDDGSPIWYLGGALAEEGVTKNEEEQNRAALKELTQLFPWLDFNEAEFSSFMIDRAEPLQMNGLKPEAQCNRKIANMTIAWPTKLAFAPRLADDIVQQIQKEKLVSKAHDLEALKNASAPLISKSAWEMSFAKTIDR